MNIPESAIRPFEPFGIPKLRVLPYASVEEALDYAFETMNQHGQITDKPIGSDAIKLFLYGCLTEPGMGVLKNSISINVWFEVQNRHIRVALEYAMPDKTRHRYTGLVRSRSGFKRANR